MRAMAGAAGVRIDGIHSALVTAGNSCSNGDGIRAFIFFIHESVVYHVFDARGFPGGEQAIQRCSSWRHWDRIRGGK